MITRRHLIGAGASGALAVAAGARGGRAASRATSGRIITPKLQISGVFSAGTAALDPKDYYTPSNESPAVSTADYYHMHACQFLRPYDLDSMGSAGAAVRAANGNNRYVWFMAAEHPEGGTGIWRDSMGFKIGFSNDPGVLPPVAIDVIPGNNQFTGGPTIPGTTGYIMRSDMAPSSLVYNPDDTSHPFYLYTQGFPDNGVRGTQSVMWKSSNMFDWVGGAWGPKNIDDPSVAGPGLTSFQNVTRRGTGDWVSYGVVGNIGWIGNGEWISTDGKTFTYNTSTIFNFAGYPSVNLTVNTGSRTPRRITANANIFSPSDTGKGAILYFDSTHAEFRRIITYVSPTQVDIDFVNFDLAAQAVPFEFGPISYGFAPAPSALGGRSDFRGVATLCAIGTQSYHLTIEDARHEYQPTDDGMWVSLAPVDAARNVSQTVPVIRLSSQYAGIYPGPTYLINVVGYVEDGILHIYAEAGYPGPHGTHPAPHVGGRVTGGISSTTLTVDSVSGYIPIGAYVSTNVASVGQIISQSSGTLGGAGVYVIENPNGVSVAAHTRNILINGGVNYLTENSVNGGMLGEQFIDYYTCVVDSTAASRAAPFGVAASCNNNTVTISWLTTPLGAGAETQSYSVYRGDANNQATLVGNTASTSVTDTPTPSQQWWYKVVKVSNGVERKSRVVHAYVG